MDFGLAGVPHYCSVKLEKFRRLGRQVQNDFLLLLSFIVFYICRRSVPRRRVRLTSHDRVTRFSSPAAQVADEVSRV